MKNIYNTSIYFFEILVHIFSFFHKKSRLWVEGRKGIFLKLKNELKNHNNIVWFHCASLGEYEQAKPVIIAYKKKYPNHEILLTFFSPSGYQQRKNITTVSLIFYLPIDTINNAKKFIDFLLTPEGQEILLDPKIRRLPVNPKTYSKAPADFPNPFKDKSIGKAVKFDVVLSKSRYNLIILNF